MKLKPEDRSDLESFVLNLELEDDFASYISMPTRLFIHFDSLPFDIFIYVDSRYIKYINAKDPIDQSRINLIIEQGTDELYFEAVHRSSFTEMLLTGLKKQLTFKTNSFYEKSMKSSAAYNTLHEIVMAVGFKPKIINLCELALKSLQKEVAAISHNGLDRYLNMLKTREFDHRYKHIQISSYCGVSIVEKMAWPEFHEQSRKLVYASLFADFYLKNFEHFSLRKEDDICDLQDEDRICVEEHPLRAAKLLEPMPFICSDVLKMILQHHGSPTGIGLKNYHHPSLSQLSLVLITAHEFTTKILFCGVDNFKQHIKDLKDEHRETQIVEYLNILEQALE